MPFLRFVADLEELRASLGLERWIVTGGSWGQRVGACVRC